MKPSFKDILDGVEKDIRARVSAKLPEWAGADIEIPTRLALEQCSSSATAAFKASVAAEILRGRLVAEGHGHGECIVGDAQGRGFRIADLTGGLGSDSFAFSRVAGAVWYNERDAALSEAAERNFARLGVGNIEIHDFDISLPQGRGRITGEADGPCGNSGDPCRITGDTDGPSRNSGDPCGNSGNCGTPAWVGSLRSFAPDLIFLDPARRSSEGKKVFLLEDCSPDIAALYPILLDMVPLVMVKLSPMADITMVCRRLGGCVSDVYVVGLDGECKELLCVLRKGFCGETTIHVRELDRGTVTRGQESSGGALSFTDALEKSSKARYPLGEEELDGVLLEALPSLMKSGARNLLCGKFDLVKLSAQTHLYLDGEGGEAIGSGLFRAYRILGVTGLDKSSCRKVAATYPAADISSRGLPLSSEQLRSRLGIRKSGGGIHIFGAGVSISGKESKMLIVTEPLRSCQSSEHRLLKGPSETGRAGNR